MKRIASLMAIVLFVMSAMPALAAEVSDEIGTLSADILLAEDIEVSEAEDLEPVGTVLKYSSQPAWYTNSGYDAVVAYLTDNTGKYVKRCFFVGDGTEWLLYDYGATAAAEFFSKTEKNSNGLYVPVQKSSSRKDNTKTPGIDESKIPLMSESEYSKLVYDWRALAEVPFIRDSSGKLDYALESDSGGDTPSPTPTPSGEAVKVTVPVGESTYEVHYTGAVVYNGRKHVLSTMKATKKQSPDIKVSVYRNGTLLEPKRYSVKFANNTNANGYGKEGSTPFFIVNLKGVKSLKADKKKLAAVRFTFNITPADIAKVNLAVKKVTFCNGKMTIGGVTATIEGVTLKLVPQTAKNRLTGSYTASYKDGCVTVSGTNNYAGTVDIGLSSAKTISYTF